MWNPLSDEDVIARCQSTIEVFRPKTQLLRILELLREGPYRDMLAVVTSLDNLSLTTALRYGDQFENLHSFISLRLEQDGTIAIRYYLSKRGVNPDRSKVAHRFPNPVAAVDFINRLMLRVPHETERSM